ncbi:ferredoxin:oxidoreductase FAD/NAD(P)-binding protein [Burkholderia sp. WAC0059]|uniref:molybdopterin-dependent oxidoreductase n=1 Tax=Burkholderia sp. WAC0059 TaxID=2066022 RepID=UPI000C7EA47A|nr:molybdopterin-dependent oxidoreductase [Burkholderia sp. WAC0059]PLZ03200.1 ferredoxin:oxidoreductase FAD/NAD(P)-binding protein [Burkholderia sp. WAC0059]
MDTHEKKGYCTLCRSRCGTVNVVRGDLLVEVRPDPGHPTGHAMCMKGRAAPELVHSPNRVLYPMRRTNPKDADDPGWQRITWDEALGEIAGKLDRFRRESGAESVAFGVTTPSGTPISDSIDWVERFVWLYGSPNICYATEICNWHKDFAHAFTFGCGMPTADYRHADVILLWGTNPASTWLAQADAIGKGRRNGAKLVVVDPRPTALAKEADVWMPVRPGTDGALAMGIARQMIEDGGIDEAFVRAWTNAPLLVRADTGRFLRERDLDPDSTQNRHAVWNASRGRLELAGEESGTQSGSQPADLALDGRYEVTVRGAGGRVAVVCVPAFRLYRDALADYTPARVESITGVPAADVVTVARMLAPGRRIAYHAWSGVGQHTNATQTERAIATLYALTGAFDTRGSNRVFAKQPANAVSTYALASPQQRAKALGLEARPLGPPAHGWVTARDVYRAITGAQPYRVRALVAFGTNMMVSQADAEAAREALGRLEFHVHCDLFETPSSRYADLFLPINTPWEREGLRLGFEIDERAIELVQLRQRMVAPRGESRADYDIVFDLAVRLGMGESFFGGSVEAGWNHVLAPLGLDVATLRAQPEGIRRGVEQRERGYAAPTPDGRARGFDTETGKVELYSEKLLRHGYPPVPHYVPPALSAPSTREGTAGPTRYPYVLTSAKNGYYCHSQQRSLPSLRRRAPWPVAEIGPALAGEKGIADGDWIVVRSAAGSARFRARVVEGLARDVVVAEYGWWQACDEVGMTALPMSGAQNSNFANLVSGRDVDPLSGSVPLRSSACDVARDPSVDPARRAWPGWREFVVAAVGEAAAGVRTVMFAARDGGPLPDYLPGQHVSLHVPELGEGGTTRAYSLTGPAVVADRRSYTIAVRHQRGVAPGGEPFEGAMSGYIHRAFEVGRRVSLRAPAGTFVVPTASRQPVVMFAGGIGITPFVAQLESIRDAAAAPPLWLFYANRNGATHAFRERIAELGRRLPSLTVVNCYSAPRDGLDVRGRDYAMAGQLTAGVVADALIRARARFYFCGPEPMMNALADGLVARGVPPFDMFREAFRSPSKPRLDASQRFFVEFTRSNRKAAWTPANGTLLAFAEGLGIAMPSGCRVGQCESCAVRVSRGTVDHLCERGPDEPDVCFACQAVPTSDVAIEA